MTIIDVAKQQERRVEYRPPIIYCKECRHRIGPLAECALAHYLVGPNDYCSKGDKK